MSIIIPVFNDQELLNGCLRAIEKQTYPADSFEVIVVDNGSTPPIACASDRLDLRLVVETRPGAAAARNAGVRAARGEIFAFTDADCEPGATWVEAGVQALHANPGCSVGGRIEFVFKNPARPTAVETYDSIFELQQHILIKLKHFAATANMFANRAAFDEVGFFDDRLMDLDDADWGNRFWSTGKTIVYCPDAVVHHPARHGVRQMLRKRRRHIGAMCTADKKRALGRTAFAWRLHASRILRFFFPSIRAIKAISPLARDGRYGMFLRVLGFLTLLKWYSIWVYTRTLFGARCHRSGR